MSNRHVSSLAHSPTAKEEHVTCAYVSHRGSATKFDPDGRIMSRFYALHGAGWADPEQRRAHVHAELATQERARRFKRRFQPNIWPDARAAPEQHYLQWEHVGTARHAISPDGCTLTRTPDYHICKQMPWGTGRLIAATEGPSLTSWLVRVDRSEGNRGFMCIGICDPSARCAWGLSLCTGQLERNNRDLDGCFSGSMGPPLFWPCGDGTQVLHDAQGRPAHLEGRAVGSVIKVCFDREAGVLAYSINDGPPLTALTGFPKDAAVRPWALLGHVGDEVTIGGYAGTGGGSRSAPIETAQGPVLLAGSCPELSEPSCRATTYWTLTSNDYRLYE